MSHIASVIFSFPFLGLCFIWYTLLISGFAAPYLKDRTGYAWSGWSFIGLIIGVLALLASIGMLIGL